MALEYIILLYAGGLVLIIAEVFVPGGLLGLIGAICLAVSIYSGFMDYGLWVGLVQLGIAIVVLPLAFYFALKRLRLAKSLKTEEGFASPKAELEKLIGKEGVTFTDLRPSGTVLIEGRKIDVVTEGGMIDKNIPVKVLKVEGSRIVVRTK